MDRSLQRRHCARQAAWVGNLAMATIYDVARRAGVSAKTVSRVLNSDAPVKGPTREAVETAIAELGYVPSSAARMMRSNKSGLIGLITGAISQGAEEQEPQGLPDILIVRGIQSAMTGTGKTLMIADTGGKRDRVGALFRTFLQHRAEGLIYLADFHQEVTLPPLPGDTPLVLANCFDSHGTAAIVPDDVRGQRELTNRLIRAGHRRIAYLTLRPDIVATRLRTDGYRAALDAAGIAFDPALVAPGYLAGFERDSQMLWDRIDGMLALPEPPTVFACGNDELAMRAYGILRTRGLKVPEEISVAGYDNHRAIAETLYPPLTTVELPYRAMGVRAAERLLALMDGTETRPRETGANPVKVAGPLYWRGSVTEIGTIHNLKTQGRTSR